MKVTYKNDKCGRVFPEWTLDGALLTLRGGALTLDLDALTRDDPALLLVMEDAQGRLALGEGRRYVAELRLPARRYAVEKIGFADDFGFPALRRVALPFSAEDVVLTLWAEREVG